MVSMADQRSDENIEISVTSPSHNSRPPLHARNEPAELHQRVKLVARRTVKTCDSVEAAAAADVHKISLNANPELLLRVLHFAPGRVSEYDQVSSDSDPAGQPVENRLVL